MELWTPPRHEPELLAWWGPLLRVARLAREEGVPWPIHIDQFDLLGRIDRSGSRLPVWVYRHQRSGRDIYADPTGQAYRFRPTPKATGPGRFDKCDVRACIHLAGLPDVVEPVDVDEGYESDHTTLRVRSMSSHPTGNAARPTAQSRTHCRPGRSRVARQDRWLYAVPARPA